MGPELTPFLSGQFSASLEVENLWPLNTDFQSPIVPLSFGQSSADIFDIVDGYNITIFDGVLQNYNIGSQINLGAYSLKNNKVNIVTNDGNNFYFSSSDIGSFSAPVTYPFPPILSSPGFIGFNMNISSNIDDVSNYGVVIKELVNGGLSQVFYINISDTNFQFINGPIFPDISTAIDVNDSSFYSPQSFGYFMVGDFGQMAIVQNDGNTNYYSISTFIGSGICLSLDNQYAYYILGETIYAVALDASSYFTIMFPPLSNISGFINTGSGYYATVNGALNLVNFGAARIYNNSLRIGDIKKLPCYSPCVPYALKGF